MENNQKNFRYQNTEGRPKTFNNFNNLDSSQNKPPQEGNWRSKGLEGVNCPQSNNPFPRKQFQDSNNNQNNFKNINTNYSSNQMNYYNNKQNTNSVTTWLTRYNRRGFVKKHILSEDEQIFAEHIENLNKKKDFDFNSMNTGNLFISFEGNQIDKQVNEKFSEIGLNAALMSNFEKMNFDQMTPIQKNVIPIIIEGNDVMACSQTGSGKTIAFLAPIVNKMLIDGPPSIDLENYPSAPVALILIPTRELAEQIYKEGRKLLHQTGIHITKIYGGVPHDSQVRELREGTDILVATPGRLIDFLNSKLITLKAVKYLILDEADRILDLGFSDQLNSITFNYDLLAKTSRQNLLFSATFSNEVKTIANNLLNNYYFCSVSKENNANDNIEQILVQVDEENKIYKLHEILQQINGSVLIFMETKKSVDNLSVFLNKANYNTISIHGDKQQPHRLAAIQKFSKGEVPILIATDVASRGLDFPYIPYVFNFDMPNNIDDYIHRIGRTGRCGNKGTAISFLNDTNRPIIKDLFNLFKKHKQEIPDWFEELFKKYQYDKSESYGRKNYFSNSNKFSKTSYGGNNNYNGNSNSYNNNGFKPKYNNNSNNYFNEEEGDSNWPQRYPSDKMNQNKGYDSFKKGSNFGKKYNDM